MRLQYKLFTKDAVGRTVVFYRDRLLKNMAVLAYRIDEVAIQEDGTETLVRRVF